MSHVPGDNPHFLVRDRIDLIRSPKLIEQVIGPAQVLMELTPVTGANGEIFPGTVLGCRTADGVFRVCDPANADGSQIPSAIALRLTPDGGAAPVGSIIKTALVFRGHFSEVVSGDFIHPNWGATASIRYKAVLPFLRAVGLVAMTSDLFSYDGATANPVQVTMITTNARPCILKDGEIYQPGPGDVLTLPADIAQIWIAAGFAV